MDEDLAATSREQLIDEVRKLPEKQDPLPIVPEWPEFIRGCVNAQESSMDRCSGGNMRMIRVAVALTASNLVLLLATMAQRGSATTQEGGDVLRGNALELVDQRGQIRARLNIEPDGQVVLRLLDQKGTIRVKLGADKAGSGLVLNNDATEPGVHIIAKAAGSTIRLANKDGRERMITP